MNAYQMSASEAKVAVGDVSPPNLFSFLEYFVGQTKDGKNEGEDDDGTTKKRKEDQIARISKKNQKAKKRMSYEL